MGLLALPKENDAHPVNMFNFTQWVQHRKVRVQGFVASRNDPRRSKHESVAAARRNRKGNRERMHLVGLLDLSVSERCPATLRKWRQFWLVAVDRDSR